MILESFKAEGAMEGEMKFVKEIFFSRLGRSVDEVDGEVNSRTKGETEGHPTEIGRSETSSRWPREHQDQRNKSSF